MNIPLMNTLLNELETNYNTKVEITISLKLTIEWEEKHQWKLIAQTTVGMFQKSKNSFRNKDYSALQIKYLSVMCHFWTHF